MNIYILRLVAILVIVVCGLDLRAAAVKGKALVAHYKFDTGKGKIAKDSSGYANNGKIHGAKFIKDGKNYALKFDGRSCFVNCGNNSSLNPLGREITVSLWIKKKATLIQAWNRIISKKATWSDYEGFYLGCRDSNPLFEFVGSGDITAHGGGNSYAKGWLHIVAVIRDTGKSIVGAIYINGKSIVDNAPVNACLPGKNYLYIGCFTPRNGFFTGILDEIRIYNYAISPKKIKEIFEKDKVFFQK